MSPQEDLQGKAAVMIVTQEQEGQEYILLTRRTKHLNSHSGEVAFPGGKWESGDKTLLESAFRETFEEVGVAEGSLRIRGELPLGATGNGTEVKPFIAIKEDDSPLELHDFEIESAFWFPFEVVLSDKRERTDLFCSNGTEYWAPVYHYRGYQIWGFTARTLVAYANRYYSAAIERAHTSAPEVKYKRK